MPEVIDFRNFLVVVAAVTALFVFGATTRSERGREGEREVRVVRESEVTCVGRV
jgi:hypothetical protein